MALALATFEGRWERSEAPVLPSSLLGMIFLLFSETMFFAGLISAYWVLRSGFEFWPPAGQPRLPVVVTAVNTAILLCSGIAMAVFRRRIKGQPLRSATPLLWVAFGLGGIFLLVQGYEWSRLLSFGLTTQSSLYGATFYLLIGAHAFHVLAGLVLVAWLCLKFRRSNSAIPLLRAVDLTAMYWLFVVTLWPVLYALVYF